MSTVSIRPKSDRRPLVILVFFYVALWVLMAVTWMYDDAGYTVGMPGPIFMILLVSPLAAGAVVGYYKADLRSGIKAGMIAGALFGAANIIGNLIWGLVLSARGRIPADQPFTFLEGMFEALSFLVFFALVGLVLGAIGGALGAAVSARSAGTKRVKG